MNAAAESSVRDAHASAAGPGEASAEQIVHEVIRLFSPQDADMIAARLEELARNLERLSENLRHADGGGEGSQSSGLESILSTFNEEGFEGATRQVENLLRRNPGLLLAGAAAIGYFAFTRSPKQPSRSDQGGAS